MAIALTPFVRLGYSPRGRDALVVHLLRDVERTPDYTEGRANFVPLRPETCATYNLEPDLQVTED